MSRVEITGRFKESAYTRIISVRVANSVESKLLTLKTIPTFGSSDLPQSIRKQFGEQVRKISCPPFLIIYEYFTNDDLCVIYDLIHERQAY